MKVCHINTLPFGGAAKVANRIHKSLINRDIDSYLLLGGNVFSGERILSPYSGVMKYLNSISPFVDNIPTHFFSNQKRVDKWSNNWIGKGISKSLNQEEFDIVNLHWIGNGFVGIDELKKIRSKLFFTIHDSWIFTGGCHIPYDCEKYIQGCHCCPQLLSNKKKDLSFWLSSKKKKAFEKKELIFISPSNWMKSCAEKSFLLREQKIFTIYNGIDLDVFKPHNKLFCRELLGLSRDKTIIVFSAVNNINDKLKGFHLLLAAIEKINTKDIEIIVLGTNSPKQRININCPIRFFGPIFDDFTLSLIYSSATMVVVPSLSESLSLTSVESLACGTPIVAFEIGGIPEVIDHKVNGWLAKLFDVQSFAKGIEWVIENSENKEISKSARKKAEEKFDVTVQCNEYIKLYCK